MACADCSNLLPTFDSRSASSLPPTPLWEGIHWRVTDVLFLSRDSSCLMLLKIWSPPGDWRLCRMDRQSVRNTVLVGSLSSWFRVWAAVRRRRLQLCSLLTLPCSHRRPDGSAMGELNETPPSVIEARDSTDRIDRPTDRHRTISVSVLSGPESA